MKEHISYQEKELCKCFIRLVNEVGYSKINISLLTRETGINRTTFYLYFSDKSELAEYICYTFLDEYYQILARSLSLHDRGKMYSTIMEAFDNNRKNAETIRALWSIHEAGFAPYLIMQKGMCDTIIRSLSDDQGLDPLNIEFFAESFSASAMATARMFIRNGCRDQEQIVNNICTACYEGMSAVLR